MITVHVEGINLGDSFHESFLEHEEFDFDGQNDGQVELDIRDCFHKFQRNGIVNVCCVSEDSQVPHDSVMAHLRYSKPYAYSGSNVTDYKPSLSFDEIEAHFNS